MFWDSTDGDKVRQPVLPVVEDEIPLREVVGNLEEGVLVYDPNFKVMLLNKAASQILGVSEVEVLGKIIGPETVKDAKLRLLTQIVFPSLAPTLVKETEGNVYPQIVFMDFAEDDLKLRVLTDRLMNPAGETRAFFKVIKNRTREDSLVRAKSDFITVAAHQLRTPLTAVNWIFENLNKSNSLSDGDREMVRDGLQVGAQLLKAVNDLLDVAKIEDGRFGYTLQDLDPVKFVEEVLKAATPIAKEYGLTLYFDKGASSVPQIYADPAKLGIALSNILDNAMRYNTKNGSITAALEIFSDKPYLQISIKDTGIGIPPEEMPKLFTKFFRAENAKRVQTSGSGLGLYIAKNIVSRHGGTIWAESTLGRGTTLYFTLPTDKKLVPPKEVFDEE